MIQWKLDEKEADYIMNVLAQRPFGEVHQIINKLLQQANAPKTDKEFMDELTQRQGDELVAMARGNTHE